MLVVAVSLPSLPSPSPPQSAPTRCARARDLQAAGRDQHHRHAGRQRDQGRRSDGGAAEGRRLSRRRHAGARARPAQGQPGARYRGTGARKPLLLLAHLDVVEAKREDWSIDPFTLLEKDGFFYGRGTSDDKAMASQFVANLIRLKEEGFTPDRDLILALTADEEGGDFNGVDWLRQEPPRSDRRRVRDQRRRRRRRCENGKYLINEVQASEKVYQDFKLEVTNPGGHSSLPVQGQRDLPPRPTALARLAAFDFPVELNEVTRAYFERIGGRRDRSEDSPPTCARSRSRRRIARRPRGCRRRSPYYNAMMRTTCVATMLLGRPRDQRAAAAGDARTSTAASCRARRRRRCKQKLVEVLADPKIAVVVRRRGEAEPAVAAAPRRHDAVESLTKADVSRRRSSCR